MKRILTLNTHELLFKQHLQPKPQPYEDGLRTDPNVRGSFEWWYFDAWFDDNSTAVLVYYTKPPAGQYGTLQPGIQLTITYCDEQGKNQVVFLSQNFDPSQFQAKKETCDVHIADNWAKGDMQTYEIYGKQLDSSGNPVEVELKYESIVPPWRPDINYQYMNNSLTTYFGWLPVVSSAKVTGTMTYNGKVHPVKGFGYHDHNWGNSNMLLDFTQWTWGRVVMQDDSEANYTLIFTEIQARSWYGNQKIPVLMLAKNDEIIVTDGYPMRMESSDYVKDPVSGRSYPRTNKFFWQRDGATITFSLTDPQIIQQTSYLYALPQWLQKIIRLFWNPYYFRFEATINFSADLPGLKQTLPPQKAIYELMLLN